MLTLQRLKRVVLAVAGMACSAAFADVWTYVDAQGVAYFASSQIDSRYQLFFKESSSSPATESPVSRAPVGQTPVVKVPANPKVVAQVERLRGFQAVKHHLQAAADTHQVDYELLQAVVTAESAFNPVAVSPKGAVGLMQIMPKTARRYGLSNDKAGTVEKKLTDPHTNINTGTRYLRDLLEMFPGRPDLAVAAYNAGEDAVQKAGNKVPNYQETQNYVKTVMQLYTGLKPAPAASAKAHVHGAPSSATRTPTRMAAH